MLVRNYGLYWDPEKVFWGYPKTEGALLGVPARHRTAGTTDFREQIGIYVLYRDFAPVYAGQTGTGNSRLFKRLRIHRRDHLSGRWNSFSWFGVLPVNTKSRRLRVKVSIKPKLSDVLNHIEAILCAAMEPPLNLQRGRFGNAVQYIQTVDDRIPSSAAHRIVEIQDQLARLEKAVMANQ